MNYNIVVVMELKFNVGFDCFWVWFILVDYVEGELKLEKFVVKFKIVEIVRKFKEVFDDLKEFFFLEFMIEIIEVED